MPENEFRWYGHEILKQYDDWLKTGKRGINYTELHHDSNLEKNNNQNLCSENFYLKNSKSLNVSNESVKFYFIN